MIHYEFQFEMPIPNDKKKKKRELSLHHDQENTANPETIESHVVVLLKQQYDYRNGIFCNFSVANIN